MRLEIAFDIDKKKSELYFSFSVKKILTEKPKRACPQAVKSSHCRRQVIAFARVAISLLHHAGNVFLRLRFNMPRVLIAFAFLIFVVPTTRSAEELLPPFGFRWNDTMARVDAVLKGAKATIVSREKKENRQIWTVEGLVHPGLKRTLFTFKGGALFGVELQYEYPDWSIERYNERMGEIRRYFDTKYGTGKLVSRTRDTDSDVIQTLVGYQWTIGATMLELFYFSAQHDALVFRTISVDYKAL
ncbi:MAG: hypothetical protein DME35_02880 [Verrucomicrobia bacterium]|nr:MAG: hypothetical protein DME35_02880 [Verrucomicrobiota bacterium]